MPCHPQWPGIPHAPQNHLDPLTLLASAGSQKVAFSNICHTPILRMRQTICQEKLGFNNFLKFFVFFVDNDNKCAIFVRMATQETNSKKQITWAFHLHPESDRDIMDIVETRIQPGWSRSLAIKTLIREAGKLQQSEAS